MLPLLISRIITSRTPSYVLQIAILKLPNNTLRKPNKKGQHAVLLHASPDALCR